MIEGTNVMDGEYLKRMASSGYTSQTRVLLERAAGAGSTSNVPEWSLGCADGNYFVSRSSPCRVVSRAVVVNVITLGTTDTLTTAFDAGSDRAGFESLQRAQAQRQPLRSTPDPHKARDRSILAFLLDTQIRQRVFACWGGGSQQLQRVK